jgi:DNA polymerase-3 subunit gamma/tau
MVAYLRDLLLLQAAGDTLPLEATPEQRDEMLAQAQRAPRQGLIEAIKRFNEAALVAAGSWQPQLPLEMAFIELLPDTPLPGAAAVAAPKVEKAASAPPQQRVVKEETAVAPPVVETPKIKIKKEAAEAPKEDSETSPTPAKATAKEVAQPLTVREVQVVWAQLVDQSGEKIKNLPALLNMGKPLATEGRTLVIGFDYPLFKDKFDNLVGAAPLVGDILTELLGQATLVRGVVTSEYTVPVQPADFRALADELGGTVSEE